MTAQGRVRQGRVHHPLRRDIPLATVRRHIAQHLLGYALTQQVSPGQVRC